MNQRIRQLKIYELVTLYLGLFIMYVATPASLTSVKQAISVSLLVTIAVTAYSLLLKLSRSRLEIRDIEKKTVANKS